MANTATLAQVKAYAAAMYNNIVLGNPTFTPTHNDISHILDKIGRQVHVEGNFVDKLPEFDAEMLSYGRIVEEWKQMLNAVTDFDRDGSTALAPKRPVFAQVGYSYPVATKTIKVTKDKRLYQTGALDASSYGEVVASIDSTFNDTAKNFKYTMKRELLGKFIKLAYDAMGSASTQFATSTAYAQGKFVNDGSGKYGVVILDIPQSNSESYATLETNGYIKTLSLVKKIAKPVDTATAEAFIQQVQDDVEIAEEQSEGTSINGITIGAPTSITLYTLKGLKSVVNVQTLAGAFNQSRLEYGAPVKSLPDFGADAPSTCFAVLMDSRACRLIPTLDAVDSDHNGEGYFDNFYRHLEFTPWASRNAFIKVYVAE